MDTERLSLSSLPQELINQIIERAAEVSNDLPFVAFRSEESDSDEEEMPPPPTTQRTLAIMSRLSIQFRTTSQRHLLRHVSLSSRAQMIKWATTGSTAHPTVSLEFRDWFEIDGRFLRALVAKRCTGLRRLLFAVGTRGGGIDEDWLSSPELSALTSIVFVSAIPASTASHSGVFPFRPRTLSFSHYGSRGVSPNFTTKLFKSAATSLRRLQFSDEFSAGDSFLTIALPLVRANLKEINYVTLSFVSQRNVQGDYEFEGFTATTHLTLATDTPLRHLLQVNALPALTHLSLIIPNFTSLALLPEAVQHFLQRLKEIRFVNQLESTEEFEELIIGNGLQGVSIVFGPRSDGSIWCTT